jgi:signal peptidase II
LALAQLPAEGTVPLIPGVFHLTLVRNTGIAFGFFREHESLLLILITASLAVLIFLGHRICVAHPPHDDAQTSHSRKGTKKRTSLLSCFGLALILGGAIGNWIDRLRFKAVIDFLDFRVWPVFNIADTAITVGAGLYFLLFFKQRGKRKNP